jgi:SAM-dependent methyltransferase
VSEFRSLEYDAYGCDTWTAYSEKPAEPRLRQITIAPYRIPFDDGFFDVVVSTGVFEHAQNKEECFREIYRVLRPGGHAVHIFPSKWYLPWEPHIFVPLANYFWPHVPRLWLTMWAMLGVRNKYQKGWSWRETRERNMRYLADGLAYWPTSKYRELSLRMFGSFSTPMDLFISNSAKRYSRLTRRLPWRGLFAVLFRELRYSVIAQKKLK